MLHLLQRVLAHLLVLHLSQECLGLSTHQQPPDFLTALMALILLIRFWATIDDLTMGSIFVLVLSNMVPHILHI